MNGFKTAGWALFWLMLLMARAGADHGEWGLIMSHDGIDTYCMTHPGTDVCTFKAVGFVDAKIEVIGAVFRDIAAHPRWMADTKETKVLKTIDRNTYVFYNVINVPFPYRDRDMIINNDAIYNLENGTATVTFSTTSDMMCPDEGRRLRLMPGMLEGAFYLEFFGRNKTRVTYMHKADPGGNIPVGIANAFKLKYYPAINLKGLREMVKKEKYIQAGLASPENEMVENMIADQAKVKKVLKNRLGDYITDPELLDMMLDTSMANRIVAQVYNNRASFESVKQASVEMLGIVAAEGLKGDVRSEVYRILGYLADKRFEDFFNIDRFMQETWLVAEVAARKDLIRGLFNKNSDIARVMFDKISASPTAVNRFIRDDALAEKILKDPALRQKLWEDELLREQIVNRIGELESLKAFEAIVAERVESFT